MIRKIMILSLLALTLMGTILPAAAAERNSQPATDQFWNGSSTTLFTLYRVYDAVVSVATIIPALQFSAR